jgi:steroid 5-alpha reductase family enzyme
LLRLHPVLCVFIRRHVAFLSKTYAVLVTVLARRGAEDIRKRKQRPDHLRGGGDTGAEHNTIPDEYLFAKVTCPHYLGEMLSWIGFAFIAQIFAAWTFAAVVILLLSFWANDRHNAYKKRFGSRFPRDRNRVIPYLF